ncbi:MAG: thioredoxin domain-containing protein [Gemmatimonadales bacterium]
MSNRLRTQSSAYLHSAAQQPVHWYPWGNEAFAAAQAQDRPVLLDIGAVWCHWCHVMDGESYEDPALAEYLNRHFICVKVDRDERPDVDARYQRAVQAFTGQGGWPLTAFLTPQGEVFYGGTYFPPDGHSGRPGFRTVLEQVLRAWREHRDRVTTQAGAVARMVEESMDETRPGELSPSLLDDAVQAMGRMFDFTNGGFGGAPKFPNPAAVLFLLTRWADRATPLARDMVQRQLQAMALGGIHDQLGGGFHRYSVDARWVVPHFEKMSYDNSELLRAYAAAHMESGSTLFAGTAMGIVRWVRGVLADPAGGYAASQDADVGLHDDGDYFTWTRDEAAAVLSGPELEAAAAYYDIGTAGEMHHNPSKNVLFVAEAPARIALRLGQPEERVIELLESARRKLAAARGSRPAPYVDRTRYTGWNAMMASALLQAGAALGDTWAGEHALLTLRRIRTESGGATPVPHRPGGEERLLEDQVHLAAAALDAYEFTGDPGWRDWAAVLMERVWTEYLDEEKGGLFDTPRDAAGQGMLPLRAKPVQDAPTPSANGVAGIVLARLAEVARLEAERKQWRERGEALLRAFAGAVADLGTHGATLLQSIDWQLHPATHLVVVGPPDDTEAAHMHRRALASYFPRRVVQRIAPDQDPEGLPPAIRGMLASGGGTRAFFCIGESCRMPAGNDTEWARVLEER